VILPVLLKPDACKVRENPISFRVDPAFAEGLDHACFERMEHFDAYVSGLQYADFDPELPGAERFLYRDAFFYNPGRGCPWRCTCCGGSWWSERMIGCRAGFFHYSTDKAVRDVSKAHVLSIGNKGEKLQGKGKGEGESANARASARS
jgi:radical SAM superfamily enzyme YgiQ (UPF0313 family)